MCVQDSCKSKGRNSTFGKYLVDCTYRTGHELCIGMAACGFARNRQLVGNYFHCFDEIEGESIAFEFIIYIYNVLYLHNLIIY